ncbi:monocarboxylate transporter 14-like isoform X2 [Varroa destructor]|nr:monocarboxylate transporter 14-like isoform X2 [Varroa destructor]XP_022649077.1 monocarboxylate transporter 14-like isoform X2 [Varroa destructor]XP_022649086.1 monocarboxylate transporter 14-like isoform X2 [Varroa destructor]XP_022649095.1 monocarboxylate transporter 14-like isoform X2 [Varroa destructor]XP_022649104.1 monocarboxylate transporter 14-like isoform X2 [Varroa destructor]XP_022649112.1 monocarboxylate transporter 14-like isoform X2 [Varroa destructor]XP_022649121.1 monocarb
MRFQGPDSCRSWAAACLAGLTQIPVLFSLKTMGVTFVGLLSEWQFSRHEASWPLTLLTASSQICGPALQLLQRVIPVSALLPLSCLASSISLMLSYFAKNLTHISIVLAFHGFCLAAIYVFSTLLLMQHFKKRRTAANAVTSTISTGATIFAPNAMQALITSYGVRNALLITGVFGLGAVPFSLGLRTPRWYSPQCETSGRVNRNLSTEVEAGDIMDAEKERFASDEISSPRSRRSMTASSTRQHPYMLTPRFIVHVISVTITYNVMNLFLLLAYDHALNIGIPESSALYVLPTYCCGDLLARFVSGIAIDANLISWQSALAFSYTVEAICLVFLVTNSLSVVFIVLSFVVGCTCGAKVTLVPVQLVNDFGLNHLVPTTGVALFVCGCVTIARPWLVGYFGDVQRSYNGLFLLVAFCCALCSSYWMSRVTRLARTNFSRQSTVAQNDSQAQNA